MRRVIRKWSPLKPTKAQVKAFAKHMARRYKVDFVETPKLDSLIAIEAAARAMGVTATAAFWKRFAITLVDPTGRHRVVYLPFIIGEGTVDYRRRQIETITHECQHVIKFVGDPLALSKYLFKKPYRVTVEKDGYRCNLELHWYMNRTLLDTGQLAARLKDYGCSKTDQAVMKKHLDKAAKLVKRNRVYSAAAKVAIKWLRENVR